MLMLMAMMMMMMMMTMIDPKVMSMWDDHDAHMLWLDRYFSAFCHLLCIIMIFSDDDEHQYENNHHAHML